MDELDPNGSVQIIYMRIIFIDTDHRSRPIARRPRRVAIFRPATGCRALCYRLGTILLFSLLNSVLFYGTLNLLYDSVIPINVRSEAQMRSRSGQQPRDPNGRRRPNDRPSNGLPGS